VQAKIEGQLAENVIMLPRTVLRSDDEIWTVNSDNELTPNKVVLLRADEDLIYVSQGIRENQLVCLTLLDNPLPGTLVRFDVPLEMNLGMSIDGID